MKYDLIIIGAGLAGLTSALALSRKTKKILIIEKQQFPKHKVCGEYISNEVIDQLHTLDIYPEKMGAVQINTLIISTPKGKLLKSDLALGGFGISRYALDHAMASKAIEQGVIMLHDTVVDVTFAKDQFEITCKSTGKYQSKLVQGAYGKRDKLDKTLNRKFIRQKAPFLAVKSHFTGDFPQNVVALHNFRGGYGGISKVEDGKINFCYIVNYKIFKEYKDLSKFKEQVLYKNPHLKKFLLAAKDTFETPLTISQINFSKKTLIHNHMIMTGDAGGMIHPLCGNGMSMAIRSAQLFADFAEQFINHELTRKELESNYEQSWNAEFHQRLKTGRLLAAIFERSSLSNFAFGIIRTFPSLLAKIIKRTHGKSNA